MPLLRQKNDLIETQHYGITAQLKKGTSKVSLTKHILDGLGTSVMTLLSLVQKQKSDANDFYLTICHSSLTPKNVCLGNFSFNENTPQEVLKVFLEKLQSLINRSFVLHFLRNCPNFQSKKLSLQKITPIFQFIIPP